MAPNISRRVRSGGGALLAVLWLSAALSAIAFSLANTVRGEVERTSTAVDGLRSYYLAQAGIERGILYVEWELENTAPPNLPFRYSAANPVLPFSFPSGNAVVQVIPETAKLNLNSAAPEYLLRLLMALGADPDRAAQIVVGIVDWRSPGGMSQFDSFYMSLTPSFRSRHASFEETEELLLVRGITPELYYGGYDHDAQGRLVPRAGLRDCVTVLNRVDGIDVNTAQPAVLMAIGIPPDTAAAIVVRRSQQPFKEAGVRPQGIDVLGVATIRDFGQRPAAQWGLEYSRFLHQAGASHLAATVLLPRRETIVRQLALPGVAARDLPSAISLQIDSLHPYGEDDVVYGWSRLENGSVLLGLLRR